MMMVYTCCNMPVCLDTWSCILARIAVRSVEASSAATAADVKPVTGSPPAPDRIIGCSPAPATESIPLRQVDGMTAYYIFITCIWKYK